MTSTWFGLEIARRGMMLNQRALDITGHNLANAETPGYTRQEAVISPTDPYTRPDLASWVTAGQLGTGAEISGVRRVKDEYLDNNVRRCTTDSAYWESQLPVLQLAEASIAEPAADGIGDRITDFFRAWMDLNNSPQDAGVKAAVAQAGDSLASLVSYTYNQLGDVRDSIAVIDPVASAVTGGRISGQVAEVNDLLAQIHNLTGSIKKVYDAGQQPNDLLDKRDMLLEKLSQYGLVNVTFETASGKPTGGMSQFTFLGMDVKQAGTSLDLTTNGTEISLKINGGTDDGMSINLTENAFNTALGGSLLGLERARRSVEDYMSKMDDLAANMSDMIAGTGVAAGGFFTGALPDGNFAVNSALLQNPTLIDGARAGDVAALRDVRIDPPGKPYTFEQYYALLVTLVGGAVKVAGDTAGNQTAIKEQIISLRDSASGVSTEEEMTRMIQYQYAFQSSARLVTVLDGMLDIVINRLVS